ncbi:hydrogenase expression/formation protein HypE [Helicobacter sp. 23-1045]
MERVMLSAGNGGAENAELIKVFLRHFENKFGTEDAGIFGEFNTDSSENLANQSANLSKQNPKKYATSIDSFTITPIFFAGGDIGKLSICGSANDVAMMGAKPKFLSASFIIEEGFLVADLEKIAQSMGDEMQKNGIALISADTKVVEKRSENAGIFITTAMIGEVLRDGISAKNLQDGDCVIISGNIGTHGACIYCEREGIDLEHSLQSDCAVLWGLVELLIKNGVEIHAMRDATRGGIASLLNEWAVSSKCAIEIDECAIPISNEVRGVCEILGIDAFSLANEGVCAFALPKDCAPRALELLKSHELGKNASIIGVVVKNGADLGKVAIKSDLGVRRYLEYPQGEILPRIC